MARKPKEEVLAGGEVTVLPDEIDVAEQAPVADEDVKNPEIVEDIEAPDVPEEPEQTPVDSVDRSNLIKCTVERLFLDGNISARFEKLGYSRDEWKAGEVRFLTADVYQACLSSGARISIVAEG